jgi:hypothetical protein
MTELPQQHAMLVPYVQGLSVAASTIIEDRFVTLVSHMKHWATVDDSWRQVTPSDGRKLLGHLVQQLRRTLWDTPGSPWLDRVFALAQAWGLEADVLHSTLVHCLEHGWLDRTASRGSRRHRPIMEEIWDQFLAVLAAHDTVERRAVALVEAKLCRDIAVARLAARQFFAKHIRRAMVSRSVAILDAWVRYEKIGLLALSVYPFYEELRMLEEYTQRTPPAFRPSPDVLPQVRADVVTVAIVLQSLSTTSYKLYHQHLWTEPVNSENRVSYSRYLFARLRRLIHTRIAEARGCELSEAEVIFDNYRHGGFSQTIDYRWVQVTGERPQAIEDVRFMEAVRRVSVGIEPTMREEIERLAALLLQALQNTGIPFSRTPLVTELPSSRRRRNWGRRLSFGLPSIAKRRHQRRQNRHSLHVRSSEPSSVPHGLREDELVAEFARLSVLLPSDAAHRLRNVVTYGVMGFVPRSHWYKLFDERLIRWLQLGSFCQSGSGHGRICGCADDHGGCDGPVRFD